MLRSMKILEKLKLNKDFLYALKASIPTMTGYIVMGIAFGLLIANLGFSPLWAAFMGLIIYGGTMQFIAVDLLANQTPLITVALVTFLVHSRHIFYSISMIDKYKDRGKARPYLFFALTDETYALVNLPLDEDINREKFDLYLSILDQIYWIIGDFLGALLGALSALNIEGVDFAMTALFIVIFIEQISNAEVFYPIWTGIGVSLLCLLLFGADNFLLPSMILIVLVLIYFKYFVVDKKENANR